MNRPLWEDPDAKLPKTPPQVLVDNARELLAAAEDVLLVYDDPSKVVSGVVGKLRLAVAKCKGGKLALFFFLPLFLTNIGCKGMAKQLLDIEDPDPIMIPMKPDFFSVNLANVDPAYVLDKRIRDAKYLAVELCTADDVCVPAPFVHPTTGATATYIHDDNLMTFVGHKTSGVAISYGRIYYVLQ